MKGYNIQDELKKWREPYRIYGGQELSNVAQDQFNVNSTISEVDEEDANIEAEKDEILLKTDGKLFKILGKPHSQGGTPLNVPEGSFLYSKFKPLAIDKESKELFKLKEGGKYTKEKNTPAKIVEREIDIKHHNKLFKVRESKFHDVLSKNSAEAMLQKNFTKLGQIAYLQEEVKGFPQGLPEFAMGTAPNIEQNNEGMETYKKGGFTQLSKYQTAGSTRQRDGRNYNLVTSVPKGAVQSGYEEDGNRRRYYFDIDPTTGQKIQIPFGQPNRRRGNNKNISADAMLNDPKTYSTFHRLMQGAPEDIMRQTANTIIGTGKWPTQSWQSLQTPSTPGQYFYTEVEDEAPPIEAPPVSTEPPITAPPATTTGNPPPAKEEDPLPYRPRVPFTREQLSDQAWAAYQATNINKYYPLRRQYNFTEFNPQLINTQPFIDNIRSQGSSFMQNQRTQDPRFARGNNSYAFGQMLQSGNEALGQVFNQNVGITNQANQFNTQGRNAVNAQNVDAGAQYFDQVNMTDQNYDNELRFAQNQFRSLRNQQKSMNDAMQQKLATQPTMGTRDVWVNDRTGEQSFTQVPGWTKKKAAAPLFDRDPRTGEVYYTGAGNLDMASNINRTGQMSFTQLQEILNNPSVGLNPQGRAYVIGQYLRGMMNPRLTQNFAPFTSQ